jgi:hypothetical protein
MSRRLSLGLDAVIVAVTADQPRILTADQPRDGVPALPSGLLDADGDATLELGLRRWISAQTGLSVGYIEQLYTFGDRDRQRTADGTRHLSVAYLGLVREAQPAPGAAWLDGYGLLPLGRSPRRRAGYRESRASARAFAVGRSQRHPQAPRARELRRSAQLGPDSRARALRASVRSRARA